MSCRSRVPVVLLAVVLWGCAGEVVSLPPDSAESTVESEAEDSRRVAVDGPKGSRWQLRPGREPLEPGRIEGIRVGRGADDALGPLWQPPYAPRGLPAGEVLDLCRSEDAVAAFAPSRDFPVGEELVRIVTDTQIALGCRGSSPAPAPLMGRYAFVPPGGGELQFFDTENEAFAFGLDVVRRLRSEANTFRRYHTLGVWNWTASYTAFFLAAGTVPDEVNVVEGSLHVRDGVVRGLVRNRSASRFAYGLTVELGDRVWRWPLSVQPAELAPFEIEGWHSDQVPPLEAFTVSAEMSTDVDLSRQFEFFRMWQRGYILAEEFEDNLPPSVIAELPEGTWDAAFLSGWYTAAISHPSLDEAYYRPSASFPVAAHVAWIQKDGSVFEVMPVALFDSFNGAAPQVVDEFPGPGDGPSLQLAFAPSPDGPHDYLLWVGGVHGCVRGALFGSSPWSASPASTATRTPRPPCRTTSRCPRRRRRARYGTCRESRRRRRSPTRRARRAPWR